MDDKDEDADEESVGSKFDTNTQTEIVWSVGDQCRVQWSGDDNFYCGIVKKLKRTGCGEVKAIIKFNDFDSEDNEEVDVNLLQKIAKNRHGKSSDRTTIGHADSVEDQGGLFRPLTGTENSTRIENKYGQESDSESDEKSSSADWISPTPYGTLGKVSQWKLRSPAKSQTPSRRGKTAVVQGGSAQKKNGVKGEKTSQKDVSTRDLTSVKVKAEVKSSVSREASDAVSDSTAGLDADDSIILLPANGDGHFEGFDDDDMEKPKFTFAGSSEKVPFCLDEGKDIQIPAPLNQYLRDYQREGVRFLYSHYARNRGAILGDDMGLGKTVQVIGFLSALMGKEGSRMDVMRQKPRFIRLMSDTPGLAEEKKCRPVLIIGPGSVLYNWLEELDTWAYFTVRKYHGADKATCLADVQRGKVEVVVTTFETCRDNINALNEVQWEAVIADEAHRIKGFKAQTTQALRSLKCLRRYGLTGTALQNNMTELWCILDWAQPGVLGSAEEFVEDFVHHIEQGQKQNATKRELAEARKKKEEFAIVRSQMLLRRTKKIIADQLPKKTDRVVFCRLTPLQVGVYEAVLAHPDMKAILHMDERCVCGSRQKRSRCCFKKLSDGQSPKAAMFSFMHVLLKAANHVALLISRAGTNTEERKRAKKMCDIAFKDYPEFLALARDAAFRTLSDPKYCGKMKVLQGLLSVFAKSHSKVLVFSYSTRLLDILEQHIIGEGSEYRRIDGSVSGRQRQKIVREFNSDPNIFLCLVSTKAGGLGLNMTGANKVVIFDPNWNPSHDLQAQDRAYRIGQRRDVEVFRLVSAGTIEENIYLRQIYKQQLDNVAIGTENARRYFKGIQGDADNKGELFGIKNMFRLRTGHSCLTMDILDRNSKVEAGIAGYDMAEYVPSKSEEQNAEGDNSTENDSGCEQSGDVGQSSDEEPLEVFRDFLDAVSDDDTEKSKTSTTPRKRKPTEDSNPQPSTSGLHTPTKQRKTSSRGTGRPISYDSSDSGDSNPVTPRQKTPNKEQTNLLDDTSITARVLSFLDDDVDNPRQFKSNTRLGKPKTKEARNVLDGASSTAAAFDFFDDDVDSPRQSKSTTRLRKPQVLDGSSSTATALDFFDDDVDNPRQSKSTTRLHKPQTKEATNVLDGATSNTAALDFFDDYDDSPRQSKSTTRLRKPQTKEATNVLDATSSTAAALDLLDKSDKAVSRKGRAVKPKTGRSVKKMTGGAKKRGADDWPMDDSLVTPSFSSVTSVFEQYGVLHVHDNPAVVGASRVEDHMTRCAMQDVFELSTNTQAPALLCDPMSQPSEDEAEGKSAPSKKRTRGRTAAKDHNSARIVEHGRWRILIGQTPTAIRKKQWSKLKESEKCAEGITLAQRVVRATPEERLTILKKMYRRNLDTGLHEKLDDILSKPADPLPDEPRKGGSSRKTVPKLQAGKSHLKKGPKKTRQSKPSTAKKQASMRKYIKRGVLYDDHDETQPSTSSRKQPHDLDPVSSDDSSYDIGAKVSPAKVRATQRRRRGGLSGRNRTQQQNTVSFSMFDEEDDTAVLSVSRQVPEGRTESNKDKPGTSATEDVDGLLQELGRKRTSEDIVGKSASAKPAPVTNRTKGASVSENKAANLSVLDDIFSEPDDSEKKKRKPPPRHGQRLRTEKTGSRNQQTNATGLAGSSRPNITRNPRASTSSDAFSDLMNDSTLADDEVDCFGEPTQWKKRHKVSKTGAKNVERLLQETTDDYRHLFESGRLVKKRQREKDVEPERGRARCVAQEADVDRRGLRRTVSSEVDPSGSLF